MIYVLLTSSFVGYYIRLKRPHTELPRTYRPTQLLSGGCRIIINMGDDYMQETFQKGGN